MPRAGEGRSIRIDPEVYEALLMLKRGNMTFSDVIAQMLHDCYGWSDEFGGFNFWSVDKFLTHAGGHGNRWVWVSSRGSWREENWLPVGD